MLHQSSIATYFKKQDLFIDSLLRLFIRQRTDFSVPRTAFPSLVRFKPNMSILRKRQENFVLQDILFTIIYFLVMRKIISGRPTVTNKHKTK